MEPIDIYIDLSFSYLRVCYPKIEHIAIKIHNCPIKITMQSIELQTSKGSVLERCSEESSRNIAKLKSYPVDISTLKSPDVINLYYRGNKIYLTILTALNFQTYNVSFHPE